MLGIILQNVTWSIYLLFSWLCGVCLLLMFSELAIGCFKIIYLVFYNWNIFKAIILCRMNNPFITVQLFPSLISLEGSAYGKAYSNSSITTY